MTTPNPLTITLDYADGSSKACAFSDLPGVVQSELLSQPFAERLDFSAENADKYAVLEWEDGWLEVYAIPPECSSVHRYYVINRVERVGRLSFMGDDGSCHLIEIPRRPLSLKRISFEDTRVAQRMSSRREGDKTEMHYELVSEGDLRAELAGRLEGCLAEDGIDKTVFLNLPAHELHPASEQLRRKMGLVAGRRQQDVLNFIGHLVGDHKGAA